ncbi:tyrosine-type recombinase/integrase [Halorussus limi]|uniref:Tyrosine-type recombinase/integrase n=1 Tax=Halorussus limi TaxID=2938695 RepID=A0A8U0HQ43_9EURY|nr:tyrosine-type recombinase/integrase [Halorussus limi]UPV72981.1 tyrosine-type recombinase/integrase [Halorussus limi]
MVTRTPKEKYERDMARLLGETPHYKCKNKDCGTGFDTDPDTCPECGTETMKHRRDDALYGEDLRDEDQDLIEEFARAHNPNDPTVPTADGKSYNTVARYITNLIRVSKHTDLSTATHDEINHATHELVQEGRKKSTVRQVQMTLRTFYRYHDDLDVDAEKINTFERPDTQIDDRDMLTREEIEELEAAIDHPRDLCIFHLFIYTGQRAGAIRTLRVKDVEPSDGPTGRYWLNTDADGLKNADKNGGARPLLGAKTAVRDWLKYHPASDDPDAYLITPKPKYNSVDPHEPVTNELFRKLFKKLKKETGVSKPLHPHALRHNFVTICKRDYDMADEDVKYLIGHAPDSRVMETTYSHLSDQDHIDRAEASAGYTERESESPLSREQCDVCGNHLSKNARACDRCGAVFTPDAKSAQDQIQDQMKKSYREADPTDADKMEMIDAFDDLLEDPAVKQRLIEKLADE